MRMIFGIIFAFFMWSSIFAQDSTTVRFLVKGGDRYYIRLNGELQPQTNILKVEQGKHALEVWSFKNDLYKGVLETGRIDSTNFLVVLKQSSEFNSYLAQRESYKKKLFLTKTGPALLAGVSAVALPFTYISRKNRHAELVKNEFYDQFGQIPQSTIDNSRVQYAASNVMFMVASAGFVVGTSSFFLLRKRSKALAPPVFRQQNPFTLEYLEISMNSLVKTPEFTMVLNF